MTVATIAFSPTILNWASRVRSSGAVSSRCSTVHTPHAGDADKPFSLKFKSFRGIASSPHSRRLCAPISVSAYTRRACPRGLLLLHARVALGRLALERRARNLGSRAATPQRRNAATLELVPPHLGRDPFPRRAWPDAWEDLGASSMA